MPDSGPVNDAARVPLMSQGRTAVVGAFLVALGPVSMALYTPAMPTMVTAFGTDIAAVKLTLTLFFAGFAVTQLVCGPLSDAYGRRPVAIGFLLVYLAASLAAVFAPTIETLIAVRAVQGAGAAVGVSIARAIVRDLFAGRESMRIMSTIGLMLAAGPAISPVIGAAVMAAVGWQAIFLVMVLYGAFLVGMMILSVPETHTAPDPRRARPGPVLRTYMALLRDVRFVGPALVMAATIGVFFTLASILPFVLINAVGLTPAEFGFAMLLQTGAFMAGSLITRRLLLRIDGARLVLPGTGLLLAGGVLAPVMIGALGPSVASVMGPVAVYAFGIAFVIPVMMTASLAPFPRAAGAAASLLGFCQTLGGVAGTTVAIVIGDPVVALTVILPAMALVALAGWRVHAMALRAFPA